MDSKNDTRLTTTQTARSELQKNPFTVETEFFGFHPIDFVDDVINAVNQYICDASDGLEESLVARLGNKTKEDVKKVLCYGNQSIIHSLTHVPTKGADNVLELIRRGTDVNFDRWEIYVLRNIFSVPSTYIPSPNQQIKVRCMYVVVCCWGWRTLSYMRHLCLRGNSYSTCSQAKACTERN